MNHQSISVSSKLIYPIAYWISSLDGLASTSNSCVQNLTRDFPPKYLPTPLFSYSVNDPPSTHMLKPKPESSLNSPSPLLSTSMSCWIYLQNMPSRPSTSPLPLPYGVQTTIVFHLDQCNSPLTGLPASSVDPLQSSVYRTAIMQCWQRHSSA